MIKINPSCYILPQISKTAAQYTNEPDPRSPREVRRTITNPARMAYHVCRQMAVESEVNLVEIYCSLQLALNTHAFDHLYTLCRLIIDSRDSQSREKNGLLYNYSSKGTKRWADLILQSMDRNIKEFPTEILKQNNGDKEKTDRYMMTITNRMDACDTRLALYEERIGKYVRERVPLTGQFAPADPIVLEELMQSIIWLSVATSALGHVKISNDSMFLWSTRLSTMLDCTLILRYLEKMKNCIPIVGKTGKPLGYNLSSVIYSDKMVGKIGQDGKAHGGILNDLCTTIFSTRMCDYIVYKAEGYDPKTRDIRPSLLIGFAQDYTIRDTEFEQSTEG